MALSSRTTSQINMPTSREAVERYQRLDVLGEGTYGVVYRATDRETGKTVALKKIRLDDSNEGIPQTALREVSILQEIHHQNIVNLLDVICGEGKLYLIFEFVDQDLKKAVEKSPTSFNGLKLKKMVYQLIDGLYFCHRHRIVHRDLKPANILLTADGKMKIADFGLARAFMVPLHTYTHEVVTLWYRAPEILLGENHYVPAVDMWSVGCIMAEMSRGGQVLFRGDSEIGQLFQIFKVLGTPSDDPSDVVNGRVYWSGVSKLPDYRTVFPSWPAQSLARSCPQIDAHGIDLLHRMLKYDANDRISAKDALAHPYFDEVRPRN